jgi:hypothetical protein
LYSIPDAKSSWHKPACRDRIELAPGAPAPEWNAAVVPCPSCKTMPRTGSVGSAGSPPAPLSRPISSSASPAGEQRARQDRPGRRISHEGNQAHVVIHCSCSGGRRGGLARCSERRRPNLDARCRAHARWCGCVLCGHSNPAVGASPNRPVWCTPSPALTGEARVAINMTEFGHVRQKLKGTCP